MSAIVSPEIQRRVVRWAPFVTFGIPASCLANNPILKTEAMFSRNDSWFQRTTRLCISEDSTLHKKREKLQFHAEISVYCREKFVSSSQVIVLICHILDVGSNLARVKKKTQWPETASELYRPSDRRLSAKRLPTCADRGCHVVSATDPSGRILSVF
jgi:hypothetical protein